MQSTTHTLPESAEYLRMALPLMSKFNIPVTPGNYAVWYEYAAGSNQSLNERIDALLHNGTEITQGLINVLYREFIDVNGDLTHLEKAQARFSSLHANVSSTLDRACGNTSEYGESLNQYKTRIDTGMNSEQLRNLIGDLNSSTNQMLVNNRHLLRDLNEARQEITELKKQLVDVRKESQRDNLTSLLNRKAFFEELQTIETDGTLFSSPHCLFMLDIDHFKKVNDTFGHLFGDKVIKAVAMVLRKNTKGRDIAARFGGEEFIVLLPETGIAGARVVAEKIRQTIEQASIINPNNKQVVSRVTVSIGLTQFMEHDDVESVVLRADKALYAAKNKGRNQVVEAGIEAAHGSGTGNSKLTLAM